MADLSPSSILESIFSFLLSVKLSFFSKPEVKERNQEGNNGKKERIDRRKLEERRKLKLQQRKNKILLFVLNTFWSLQINCWKLYRVFKLHSDKVTGSLRKGYCFIFFFSFWLGSKRLL